MILKSLLISLLVGLCYSQHENPLPRMQGGLPTAVGEFPSIVSIETPTPLIHCGGIIVNEFHVITSCQCVLINVQTMNPFFFRVIAGDLNLVEPGFRRFTTDVTHIYHHPDYNPITRVNDIAVMRVATAFPFPANMLEGARRTTRVFPVNQICRFAGWGVTQAIVNQVNAVQQAINAPIISNVDCNVGGVHGGQVLNNMICAGHILLQAPPVGVCNGNIGSGLFCNDELVGILSFGLGCGLANSPGVYTSVRAYSAWIEQQFDRTDSLFP